jgi:hypothetical protein
MFGLKLALAKELNDLHDFPQATKMAKEVSILIFMDFILSSSFTCI